MRLMMELFPRVAKAALAVSVVIIAISAFFLVVGLPGSYESVAEYCSVGSPCVSTTQSGSYFSPEPIAAIPLLLVGLVGFGIIRRLPFAAWAGLAGLLAFSFISLVSIGILYLPFVIVLVGLTAANRRNPA